MIEVFKTNVDSEEKAEEAMKLLNEKLAGCEISFDVQDCDHVLRIDSQEEHLTGKIIALLSGMGFQCETLSD
ncbi:MAG TPA: hypothetical protein VFU15_05040 [Bacteroidia bacterium]|nr:hypothetical protein [Bacteroidia bacterium]